MRIDLTERQVDQLLDILKEEQEILLDYEDTLDDDGEPDDRPPTSIEELDVIVGILNSAKIPKDKDVAPIGAPTLAQTRIKFADNFEISCKTHSSCIMMYDGTIQCIDQVKVGDHLFRPYDRHGKVMSVETSVLTVDQVGD